MRWVIPAAVVATGLGVLMLYVPLGKGAALIVPPQAPLALVLAGTVGIVFGVTRAWWSRSRQVGGVAAGTGTDPKGAAIGASHRLADATALTGLAVALAALLAVTSVFIVEPILASLQGPDPCGPSTFLPNHQPDIACFSAHPDYYHHDPVAGSWSTPGSRLSQTLDPVAGPAALPLALGAILISWLALAMGTGRRRTALSALTLGSLIVVLMVVLFIGLVLGGGGD